MLYYIGITFIVIGFLCFLPVMYFGALGLLGRKSEEWTKKAITITVLVGIAFIVAGAIMNYFFPY